IPLACIDRHHQSGRISLGIACGLHLKKGAVASTVAHDSHNMLVMGADEQDMATAANALADSASEMIAVCNGRVLAHVLMPIAGLLSHQYLHAVVRELEVLEKA